MQIRQVILDWSGTLVDDLPPVFQATNHVLTSCGLPPLSLPEFRQEFCLPIRKFYSRHLPAVPVARVTELFFPRYRQLQHLVTLLPQTMGFLEFCRQAGLRVYIATTVDAATYEAQARRFGIDGFVSRAYTGLTDKTEKIHEILADNQLMPGQTLFVGDMEHDIAAGRAGGLFTCAVLTGYNPLDKLRAAEPDMICEHLTELQARLAAPPVVHG